MRRLAQVFRRVLGSLAATLAAAAVATVVIAVPLFMETLGGNLRSYLFALLYLFPLIAILLGGLAWAAIGLLRAMRLLSLRSLSAIGGTAAAVVNLGAGSLLFGGSAAVWLVFGALSGVAASWVLWRFGVDAAFKHEQAADLHFKRNAGKARYRAFFSYARADERVANWLWSRLDRYSAPRDLVAAGVPARLHPIFRDRVDLSAGGGLSDRLETALRASERLVVLCTPRAAASRWVEEEVRLFIERGDVNAIFPVIADGEPDSADPATECFPPSLRKKGLLAADLRDVKGPSSSRRGDGKHDGAMKLIAGLLGVGYDDLVRRERRRQQDRIVMLSVAAAISATLGVAAVFLAFVSLTSLYWSHQNLMRAVEGEFHYIVALYQSAGEGAAHEYVAARSAAAGKLDALVCVTMTDGKGAVLAGSDLGAALPLPEEIGRAKSFSSELAPSLFNYEGSPFHLRSDGWVARMSGELIIAAASCNLEPPMFYGLFRALFTPEPDIGVGRARTTGGA